MLGLAAVRATTQQTRMAAAMQFHSSAFQQAESSIRLVLNEIFAAPVNTIAGILTGAAQGTAQCRSDDDNDIADNDCGLNPAPLQLATMNFRGVCTGSIITGESLSSSFDNCCFDIEGTAQIAEHQRIFHSGERVNIRCPKQD